jgi:hypothetical protein
MREVLAMDDLAALRDQMNRLHDAVVRGGGPPGDLTTLTAHRDPAAAVRMAGRAPLCATCGQPMPCPSLRELARVHGFDEWDDVLAETPGVVLEESPNVKGPTGVVLDTGDGRAAAGSGDRA